MADNDPLASWMWRSLTEPPLPVVDHVIVNVDMLDGAAEVQRVVQLASRAPPGDGGRPDVASEDGESEDPLFKELARHIEMVDKSWIWRVHPSARQKEKDEAYEPKLVSIGPLHFGKEELSPMDDMKFRYLKHLFDRSPKKKIDKCIKDIRNCEGRAREQYAATIDMKEETFVSVLVVDGCFIIEYFLQLFSEKDQEAWVFSPLRRDLMLLENQIPFFVLEKLFERLVKGTPEAPATFKEMALKFLNLKLPIDKQADEVHHLLHLQYLCLTSDLSINHPVPAPYSYPIKTVTSPIARCCVGLINACLWRPAESGTVQKTIPCATELERYGVKLKRKVFAKAGREVKSYLDVSFTEGTLEIPFIRLGESTSSKLCNFVALEQRRPSLGSSFISYAIFMDNLINSEADVALLRKCGIVDSKLSGDIKQEAKIFNSLCEHANLYYKPQYRTARTLFESVIEYCDVPHRRWRHRLWSTYRRSPWTPISILAATILLAATIIQTCLTISDHVNSNGRRR